MFSKTTTSLLRNTIATQEEFTSTNEKQSARLRAVCSNAVEAKPRRGFTMLELLVVVGIIGLLSIVIFAGYRNYDGKALLQNVVYETSLSMREAQIMSIGVTPGAGSNFNLSYGLRFSSASSANTSYTLYSRSSSNVETPVKTTTLNRGNYINGVYTCATPGQDVAACTPVTGNSTAGAFFIRPHLEATFYVDNAVNSTNELVVEMCPPSSCTASTKRYLRISRSGRVAIQ